MLLGLKRRFLDPNLPRPSSTPAWTLLYLILTTTHTSYFDRLMWRDYGIMLVSEVRTQGNGDGAAWSERLRCNTCPYVNSHYKLYEEQEAKSRERKRSTLNTAMQTALMGTSVSNAAMIEICLTANIIPPSHTGLQNKAMENKLLK